MFKISSLTLTLQRCGNFNKAQMNITMAFHTYILPRITDHTPCRNESLFTHIHHIVNLPTKKEENAVVYPENSMTIFINILLSTSRTDKSFYDILSWVIHLGYLSRILTTFLYTTETP